MIQIGKMNSLKVIREKDAGVYLDGTPDGILLPKRFVPKGVKTGDEINVFLYHDSEDRIIATTQVPKGQLDDIVLLKVVEVTSFGAFLDWGLMKDLFIPKSQMRSFMRKGGEYFVRIVIDEKTGRLSATEYFEPSLSNEHLKIKERDEVQLTVYRKTQIGYEVIINNTHKGILHFNEVYRPIKIGDRFPGFIKKIFTNKETGKTLIDVAAGKQGYSRVDDESETILKMLKEQNGFLPFNDKSSPESIYEHFKMSKKTFKMAVGRLYKERKIMLTKAGIQSIQED
ncbi:MAG: RNA-binding protein [Chitinophagaceae bacterium]|nr:RNA-binding protein [Chitinophagaceae bacterium]